MFPSSPPTQPSSPPPPPSPLTKQPQPLADTTALANENFYEFFFSHLPIIEYQIKELKERLVANLPLFFHPTSSAHNQRASLSAQPTSTSVTRPIKCPSCTPSKKHHHKQQLARTDRLLMTANLFAHKLLIDLDEYERRFQLLYLSPRLEKPAWLTINRQQVNARCSNADLCDRLVSEISFLDKIKKTANTAITTTNTPFILSSLPQHQASNGSRFFNSLRNSLVREKSFFSSSPSKQPATAPPTTTDSFLATIISTVLRYHHSWVYTVLPSTHEPDTHATGGKA
jgi:hypothetical protein